LDPIVREEVLRISREALTNAFRHARAAKIEAEIIYDRVELRLRIRDDGCGIDSSILKSGRTDHWGLPGMRERAKKLRANLEVWSRPSAGTEVAVTVPAQIAYARKASRWAWWSAKLRVEH
jgi:signal transduction histidine kinase